MIGGLLAVRAIAVAVVLASQVGDASCDVTPPRACGIWFDGPEVHDGTISEAFTTFCSKPARWHVLHAWVEYRRVGEFSRLPGRDALTRTVPDATGFTVTVTATECLEGWYRTAVRTEGQLYPDPEIPHPQEFDTTLYGDERYVSLEDCQP